MNEFRLIRDSDGKTRHFDTRAEAEAAKEDMTGLSESTFTIKHVGGDSDESKPAVQDGGTQTHAEEIEPQPAQEPQTETVVEPSGDDPLAQLGEELGTDPLSILPGHMVDDIQGQPAVNKRGYAMIAERYGIETTANILSYPWDNEEGRCVAKAVAVTEDNKQYTGHATACAADGDMEAQIIELAETRALKRSLSWASGVGIVSYQELAQELE